MNEQMSGRQMSDRHRYRVNREYGFRFEKNMFLVGIALYDSNGFDIMGGGGGVELTKILQITEFPFFSFICNILP